MTDRTLATSWGKRAWTALLAAACALMLALPASAAEGYLVDIPIDTVVRAPEDSKTLLATVDVPAEFQGQMCVASAASNNDSIHPDNDLLVESGSDSVVIPDVERTDQQITIPGEGSLTLGSQLTVSLLMGPDKVFSAGITVTVDCEPSSGRIIVVKEVTEGSDTGQAFDFEASYDSDGFQLSDGEQNDSGALVPGTYSVTEEVPDGWSLASASCDDQSPIDAIDLESGETVTCTFVNDEEPPPPPETGEIIVEKVVTGGDSPFAFTFETEGFDLEDNTLANGESSSSGPVEPGSGYAVSEVVPDGWTLLSATCDDGSDPGAIEVSPGETVTCTFTNQIVDDVLALVLVTVDAVCDNEGTGDIEVTMSVPGGATVEVRDSNGTLLATFTDDGTLQVEDNANYSWSATPTEGNEFPSDFDASGTISLDDCVETLPFTGTDSNVFAVAAGLLVAAGVVLLRSARPRQD